MRDATADLYLDLLKKTLCFLLWPEPPTPIADYRSSGPPLRGAIVDVAKTLAHGPKDLVIARDGKCSLAQRTDGAIWPAYAHTMIGLKRLDNLHACIERVLADGVEGDVIETGVWRGGACIFMRAVLAAYGVDDRRVFVADSFRGLPEPDARYPADAASRLHTQRALAVSRAEVEENFRKYGMLDEQVVFLEGWFKDTLPAAPVEKLSILRLDGDMYGSTIDVLRTMYPKLSVGGYCIIDDYSLNGCRAAVDDYRARHRIEADMIEVDWTGQFWRKED